MAYLLLVLGVIWIDVTSAGIFSTYAADIFILPAIVFMVLFWIFPILRPLRIIAAFLITLSFFPALLHFSVLGGSVFLLGGFANVLVMAVNGWRMPVVESYRYADSIKDPSPRSKHVLMSEKTRLRFLGDCLPSLFGGKCSLGDIFLLIGIYIVAIKVAWF